MTHKNMTKLQNFLKNFFFIKTKETKNEVTTNKGCCEQQLTEYVDYYNTATRWNYPATGH